MGKYMRKSKTSGEIAVMDFSQSSLGVRTRAKTLALQRLQKSSPAPVPAPSTVTNSGHYLQLRSRRLEKPPILAAGHDSKRQKQASKDSCVGNPNPNPSVGLRLRVGSGPNGSNGSVSVGPVNEGEEGNETAYKEESREEENNIKPDVDLGVEEASFGENVLELEGRERSTRESTPCSLIRDPEAIRTPGSTTRPTSTTEANRIIQNSMRRHIPTAQEMVEFFSEAEEKQQREFIEKYNFDPVNDKPLPGRYEWEKIDP